MNGRIIYVATYYVPELRTERRDEVASPKDEVYRKEVWEEVIEIVRKTRRDLGYENKNRK